MTVRFKDNRQTLEQFKREIIARCPQCHKRAIIFLKKEFNAESLYFSRLVCKNCGYLKEIEINNWKYLPAQQFVSNFSLHLWLEISCCGEKLWAYNEEHLDFIESYVRAEIRERSPHEKWGWSNSSLASRLPRWMKSSKNREKILKCIAQLRNNL